MALIINIYVFIHKQYDYKHLTPQSMLLEKEEEVMPQDLIFYLLSIWQMAGALYDIKLFNLVTILQLLGALIL